MIQRFIKIIKKDNITIGDCLICRAKRVDIQNHNCSEIRIMIGSADYSKLNPTINDIKLFINRLILQNLTDWDFQLNYLEGDLLYNYIDNVNSFLNTGIENFPLFYEKFLTVGYPTPTSNKPHIKFRDDFDLSYWTKNFLLHKGTELYKTYENYLNNL